MKDLFRIALNTLGILMVTAIYVQLPDTWTQMHRASIAATALAAYLVGYVEGLLRRRTK